MQQALETRPDICLLDLRMPGSGVAAAWEISARLPTTKVVMLTVSDDDASLFAALRAGAVGYLVKDLDLSLLPRALQDVADGKAAIPRDARRAHGQAVPRERPAFPHDGRVGRARRCG